MYLVSHVRPVTRHFIYFLLSSGLMSGIPGNTEYIDHYYTFGRRSRVHHGFNPQYIKFVEDAMLVLFLLCVLVTLLVVHRASCYR